MNFCERLINGASKANNLETLEKISAIADEAFSRADKATRNLMTSDFWVEFTKVIRKRVLVIKRQEKGNV